MSSAPTIDKFDLDAFGHLSWVVGWTDQFSELQDDRGDWIACVDLDRIGDHVGYHVVVDSDSGGFVDTLAQGVYTLEDAREQLPELLSFWNDIASEHLVADGGWFTDEEQDDNLKAIERWKQRVAEVTK